MRKKCDFSVILGKMAVGKIICYRTQAKKALMKVFLLSAMK